MKIAIVQLSDLHITSGDDFIVKNVAAVARSFKAIAYRLSEWNAITQQPC